MNIKCPRCRIDCTLNQRDQIAAASKGDTYSVPLDLYNWMTELQQILHQTAGRNAPVRVVLFWA